MRRGQSTVEFVVLVSVVTIAVVAMGTYVFRAVNANMKMIEDQVNADTRVQPDTYAPPPNPGD